MGLSSKMAFIREDSTFLVLTQKKTDSLFKGESAIPEFADTTVKSAHFVYELENRKPIRIMAADYSLYRFSPKGFIDMPAHCMSAMAHISLLEDILPLQDRQRGKGDNIISAERKFLKRRFEHEWKWTPSEATETDLLRVLFPNWAGW